MQIQKQANRSKHSTARGAIAGTVQNHEQRFKKNPTYVIAMDRKQTEPDKKVNGNTLNHINNICSNKFMPANFRQCPLIKREYTDNAPIDKELFVTTLLPYNQTSVKIPRIV